MIVTHSDPIIGFPIKRSTSFLIPLYVLFQKLVSMSTSITVSSSVPLRVDITSQTIDSASATATLVITTALASPYYISNIQVNLQPEVNLVCTIVPTSDPSTACSATAAACMQTFTMTIDAVSECQISGTYGISVTYQCIADASGCTLPGAMSTVYLGIVSDNLCPQIYANQLPDISQQQAGIGVDGQTSSPNVFHSTNSTATLADQSLTWIALSVSILVVVVLIVSAILLKNSEAIKWTCVPEVVEDEELNHDVAVSVDASIPKVQPRTSGQAPVDIDEF